MKFQVTEDVSSIVLLGSLNPAIFQPSWLSAQGLIRESEAQAAKIGVVHPELTSFRTDWLTLHVTLDRFVASAANAAHELALRDLVTGIFELLVHTPTYRLGMNRTIQVQLENESAWHGLGDYVLPKDPWHKVMKNPGLMTLFVRGDREDQLPGQLYAKIEPILGSRDSARIEINNDISAPADQLSNATAYFVQTIRSEWERLMTDARMRAEGLIQNAVPRSSS